MQLATILDQCLPLVRNAGAIIKENWPKPSQIHHKGVVDLVTETDTAIEKVLARDLKALLPEVAFVGEESADPANPLVPDELCWVVDPVDGTTNFVHRIPLVSVSVALCLKRHPIVGIVYAPILDQCFYATAESCAWCNGEEIHVSGTADLQQSLVVTGFPYSMDGKLERILSRLSRVLPATQGLRRLGSAAIDLAWVAAGKIEVFYEDGLKPWDMAAGWLLVERAGGRLTDFTGLPGAFNQSVLATNGLIHQEMVERLT